MNNLSNLPEDPKDILSEAAQKRIDTVLDEGSTARRMAEMAYRHDDLETKVALDAATFDYAFRYLSAMLAELKTAGIRGERLGQIMADEIQSISFSLELQDVGENQLRDLLIENDFGW